jgi:hypothetical protein
MYREIKPENPTQGCIISPCFFDATGDDHRAIILTPTCDIENDKAVYVIAVALYPFTSIISVLLDGSWRDIKYEGGGEPRLELTPRQREQLSKKIKQLMANEFPRYHWLDPIEVGEEAYICDFQLLTSLRADEVYDMPVLAYLDSEWLEQVPARFVAYQGRIGTPNRNINAHEPYVDLIIRAHFSRE